MKIVDLSAILVPVMLILRLRYVARKNHTPETMKLLFGNAINIPKWLFDSQKQTQEGQNILKLSISEIFSDNLLPKKLLSLNTFTVSPA